MSQKLNGGGRERASQVPDLHFKICNLGPKSAFLLPKIALEPAENGQMKARVTKCLENGLFWDQNHSKMEQKCVSPKNDPRPFGVHKRVK